MGTPAGGDANPLLAAPGRRGVPPSTSRSIPRWAADAIVCTGAEARERDGGPPLLPPSAPSRNPPLPPWLWMLATHCSRDGRSPGMDSGCSTDVDDWQESMDAGPPLAAEGGSSCGGGVGEKGRPHRGPANHGSQTSARGSASWSSSPVTTTTWGRDASGGGRPVYTASDVSLGGGGRGGGGGVLAEASLSEELSPVAEEPPSSELSEPSELSELPEPSAADDSDSVPLLSVELCVSSPPCNAPAPSSTTAGGPAAATLSSLSVADLGAVGLAVCDGRGRTDPCRRPWRTRRMSPTGSQRLGQDRDRGGRSPSWPEAPLANPLLPRPARPQQPRRQPQTPSIDRRQSRLPRPAHQQHPAPLLGKEAVHWHLPRPLQGTEGGAATAETGRCPTNIRKRSALRWSVARMPARSSSPTDQRPLLDPRLHRSPPPPPPRRRQRPLVAPPLVHGEGAVGEIRPGHA
eukprot:TRINITY_DN4472_c0_g2_i2.p1 TRINITY_DN4472_c0_g2~~TRINITY_DN4472_c0_g2_i2.p1  ORF type:complete len:461 (+),score=27.34 TRINITY_DN4472_c0_g2_i2:591-1973(+)